MEEITEGAQDMGREKQQCGSFIMAINKQFEALLPKPPLSRLLGKQTAISILRKHRDSKC